MMKWTKCAIRFLRISRPGVRVPSIAPRKTRTHSCSGFSFCLHSGRDSNRAAALLCVHLPDGFKDHFTRDFLLPPAFCFPGVPAASHLPHPACRSRLRSSRSTPTGVCPACGRRRNAFDQARIGTLGIKPKYITEVFVDKENAEMALHIVRTLPNQENF